MMRSALRRAAPVGLVLVAAVAWTGCYAEESLEGEELCEEAALHREQCTGEYITPPVCDEEAQREAEEMLSVDCEYFEEEFVATGKADGALCNWFGLRCSDDESIFEGPSCSSDSDCAGDSYCVEDRCFAGVGSDEFSEILDEHTESREVSGDFTQLLADNDQTREVRDALMADAEHSIHMTALSISSGEVSRQMVELMTDAARRGVEVRVAVDAAGQDQFGDYDVLDELAAGGVDVQVFNPITGWARLRLGISGLSMNNRLHEKMIIVDGLEAVVGGRNTGDSYLKSGDRKRDMDVYVHGPGVNEIQRTFLEIWEKTSEWERDAGCPGSSSGFFCAPDFFSLADDASFYPQIRSAGQAKTRTIYSEPHIQDTSHGYFTYLSAIRGAKEEIKIANAYFIPPRRLRNRLREAAERGVDVQILVNSKESQGRSYVYYSMLNFYRELIGAGVEIYEYQGSDQLHAKTMVVDGELAVVGSYNLSPRSAESNSETLLVMRDSPVIEQLESVLEREYAVAERADGDLSLRERLRARAHRTIEWLL